MNSAIICATLAAHLAALAAGEDPEPTAARAFLEAKTCFQTNVPYDPRIALAVDAVMVHRHGDRAESLRRAIGSWKERGYVVGRMFFADSDATNAYWKGKWDGKPHPDDVERNAAGDVVLCAGVRPYMLPTEGWIRYLEEMARESVDAGADAILPEEPLAHVDTGYEKSFRELWVRRYGRPWQPEKASAEARFLTAQLKNELYMDLERRLAAAAAARARELGRRVDFAMPVHSLYSNVAAKLAAPLGTSLSIPGIDGYIGQVWTGPVNWALAHYDSRDKTFFASAYALYDSFDAIASGSGRKLWLLVDPVEDDPNHRWAEFEAWYRHCVTAMLLFPDVDSYEIMPWPDRIFLPGYGTGGGTPAPEDYRIAILSATQVLQEVPRGGKRAGVPEGDAPGRIGIALSDTVLWEKEAFPPLQAVYGLLLPLVEAGVPATACLAERFGEPGYLDRFGAVVLCYEAWKPRDAAVHDALAAWVRRGGSLAILGEADDLGGAPFWWKEAGHPSPLQHLLAALGCPGLEEGGRASGKGHVVRRKTSPRAFGDPAAAREIYFPLLHEALRKAGDAGGLRAPGFLALRRGPFLVAYAGKAPFSAAGKFIDVFDPKLPVREGLRLEPGSSGLFRDVTDALDDAHRPGRPGVLHGTHRIIEEKLEGDVLRVLVRGPAGTPAVLRMHGGGRKAASVTARGKEAGDLQVEWRQDGPTVLARFPNDPSGAALEALWGSAPSGR